MHVIGHFRGSEMPRNVGRRFLTAYSPGADPQGHSIRGLLFFITSKESLFTTYYDKV